MFIMKKRKKIIRILTVAILSVMFLMASSCRTESKFEDNSEELSSLTGTEWKLIGFGDAEDGIIREPEPKDLKELFPYSTFECYLLIFETDSTFLANSSTNGHSGEYIIDYSTNHISFSDLFGTQRGEIGDGKLFYKVFNDSAILSFLKAKDKLCLYYNNCMSSIPSLFLALFLLNTHK